MLKLDLQKFIVHFIWSLYEKVIAYEAEGYISWH